MTRINSLPFSPRSQVQASEDTQKKKPLLSLNQCLPNLRFRKSQQPRSQQSKSRKQFQKLKLKLQQKNLQPPHQVPTTIVLSKKRYM